MTTRQSKIPYRALSRLLRGGVRYGRLQQTGRQQYLSYAAPGGQISRFALRGNRTGFLFVFARPDKDPALARDTASQKRALIETFSPKPWVEWPEIKSHLEACELLRATTSFWAAN